MFIVLLDTAKTLSDGEGTGAKCAAAQGGNCQDDYTKLYPTRMFADDRPARPSPGVHAFCSRLPSTPSVLPFAGSSSCCLKLS